MARRLFRMLRGLAWGSVGAVGAYFGDPDRGRSRRTRARDQAGGALRRLRRQAQRRSRQARAELEGKVARLTHARTTAPADDRALVDRIKSQILSAPRFAGLDLLVEAVNGVITLRGEVDTLTSMTDLEAEIASVPGVVDVHSLIHEHGTPAPNKQASLRAVSE